jgi:parallel beta-helix repeat protein
MKMTKLLASIVVIMGVLALSSACNAGNLEPPAAPGPTMKTLDEVEPRKPISSVPYTITESGSYYLSANAQTTSSLFNGITIWANNVTLDLKGFSLIGDETAGLHGISIEGTHKNITIRNGTITNWGGNGIEAPDTNSCRVEDLQVIDNKRSGIHLPGDGQIVTNCTVSNNGTSASNYVYGINVGIGSTVTDCTVSNNGNLASNLVYGIRAGKGSRVISNIAHNNGTSATGLSVYGIYPLYGSMVTGNSVYHNGDSATASVHGIHAFGGSTVTDNTVAENGDSAANDVYGIVGGTGGTVTGNSVYDNGDSASGDYVYGIWSGSDSTVTGNSATQNGLSATGTVYGIYLTGHNLVDQNTSRTNGSDPAKQITYGVTGCVYGVNVPPAPE